MVTGMMQQLREKYAQLRELETAAAADYKGAAGRAEPARHAYVNLLFSPEFLGGEEFFRAYSGGNIMTREEVLLDIAPISRSQKPESYYSEGTNFQALRVMMSSLAGGDRRLFLRDRRTGGVSYHSYEYGGSPVVELRKGITAYGTGLGNAVLVKEFTPDEICRVPEYRHQDEFPTFHYAITVATRNALDTVQAFSYAAESKRKDANRLSESAAHLEETVRRMRAVIL